MSKSFVQVEHRICPVCGKRHTFGCGIILDKRLMDTLETNLVSGYGLCEDHSNKIEEGYIAFIAIDEEKSDINDDGSVSQSGAHRTGVILFIKKEAAEALFEGMEFDKPIVFIDEKVAEALADIEKRINEEKEKD